jgi:hypothetical protein
MEFKDLDFADAMNEVGIATGRNPDKYSVGCFLQGYSASSFCWFASADELKDWILNAFYCATTEERDSRFFEDLIKLKDFLEKDIPAEQIWMRIPAGLQYMEGSDDEIIWTGTITSLLTQDNEFSERIREDFSTYLNREGKRSLAYRIGVDPPEPEIIDHFMKFLEDYQIG